MTVAYLHRGENEGLNLRQIEEAYKDQLQNWLTAQYKCDTTIAREILLNVFSRLPKYLNSTLNKESVILETLHKAAKLEMQKLQTTMSKNFGLTEHAFDQMVAAIQIGDDQIYERVFLSHFNSSMEYLKHNYSASHEDAYDACMETLVVFLKKLKGSEIKYGNLRFLFTKMASQVYLKWLKKAQKNRSIEDYDFVDEPAAIDEEDLTILDKAWNALDEECQELLKAFYYDKIPLNKIAENSGKNPASVRKQKQRCMEKLRKFFFRFS